MVKNRKILIEIKTDISQREADVDFPKDLANFCKKQLFDVIITPNYQEKPIGDKKDDKV